MIFGSAGERRVRMRELLIAVARKNLPGRCGSGDCNQIRKQLGGRAFGISRLPRARREEPNRWFSGLGEIPERFRVPAEP